MRTITAEQLVAGKQLPIIDVRSPGEFQSGHIPGAVNVPLFSDAERAEVGTLYKRVGRDAAIKRGLEFGTASTCRILSSIRKVSSDNSFVLHCWRGGMRSREVAKLCAANELKPTLVEGGYKAFRKLAHGCFEQPRKVVSLAGQTGSGKTRLLQLLQQAGQQMIDLEGLANHRGSVFGGIGQGAQPTVEQFENHLFLQWLALDPLRPVWIEGESQSIGDVSIPQSVWRQMLNAPAIFVEVDRADRIDFLLKEYGQLPSEELASAIRRLKKRLGGARLTEALSALENNDRRTFASVAIEYYDKWYLKSLEKRTDTSFVRLALKDAGDPASVSPLIELGKKLLGPPQDLPIQLQKEVG